MQKNRSLRERITACVLVICLLMSYLATLSSIYVTYASDEKAEVVFEAEFIDLNKEKKTENPKNTEEGEKSDSNSSSQTAEMTKTSSEQSSQDNSDQSSQNSSTSGSSDTNLEANEESKTETGLAQDNQNNNTTENSGANNEKSDTNSNTENNANTEKKYVLRVKVGVKNNGYLKDGKFEIADLDKQIFTISEISNPIIQSISNGVIKLNTIDAANEFEFDIPLEFKKNVDVDSNILQNGTKLKLTGTYVDEEAIEKKVSREETAFIDLENERKIGVGSNIEKFIKYNQDGKEFALIQIKVIVQDTDENRILPVKSTDLKIKLPEIVVGDGKEKPEITESLVIAKNTGFTNGRLGADVKFSEDNYSFDNDGRLSIHVENSAENGKYRQSNGSDEYLIELIYNNAQNIETQSVKGEIEASINLFEKQTTKEIKNKLEQEYKFDEASTSKITYDVRSLTEKFSKGNVYANCNKEDNFYETEYQNEVSLNISRANSIKTIEIKENDESYYIEDGSKYSTKTELGLDSYYKMSTFNKENLVNIIGEKGSLEILNENEESLITINKDTEANEDGNIVLAYNNKIGKIIIKINNPEKEGMLNIQNTKGIEKSNYTKESLVQFKGISNSYKASAVYDEDINSDLGAKEIKTEMVGTKTRADMEISRGTLSTIVKNEDVEFDICLNNSTDSSDMYINPQFEITLPQGVTKADIKDINLLYGNDELKISEDSRVGLNDQNQIAIFVKLDGVQKNYAIGDIDRGTTIVVKTDIELDRYLSNREAPVELRYINENATEYGSEVVDGVAKQSLNFKFQGGIGVVPAQRISGFDGENSVMSINQGEQTVIIPDSAESKIASMEVMVINNEEEIMENPVILGRIPFNGVSSLSSSESLGTNKNTKMVSGIEKILGKDFKVYYSENGEATRDLEDQKNGWKEEVQNFDNIKSYLVVPNGNIEIGESFAVKYNFEIPAELGKNVNLFGTFGTYYDTEIGTKLAEADRVGLKTKEVKKNTVNNNKSEELVTRDSEIKINNYTSAESPYEYNPEDFRVRTYETTGGITIDTGDEEESQNLEIIFEEGEDNKSNITKGNKIPYVLRIINTDNFPVVIDSVKITIPIGLTFNKGSYILNNGDVKTIEKSSLTNIISIDNIELASNLDLTLEISADSNYSGSSSRNVVVSVESELLENTYSYTKEYQIVGNEFNTSYSNVSGNSYVKAGDDVDYKLVITNTSGKNISDITFTTSFPKELEIVSAVFKKDGKEYDAPISDNQAIVSQYLTEGQSGELLITATAKNISETEKKVSSYIKIETENNEYKSETVDVIIQRNDEISDDTSGDGDGDNSGDSSSGDRGSSDSNNKYRITGTVWNDSDNSGSRDSKEKGIGNVIVKLFNAATNDMISQISSDDAGGYVFANLDKGSYYIVFEYDQNIYSLSDYRKNGVSEDRNSDAILTNGQTKTDTITIYDSSIGNIDVGLISGKVFDLSLEKTVTKLTVQNDSGTSTIEGNNQTLVKAEIKAKDLASSTVYIEYKITVTNNGQVPGTVQKIVDYLPKDVNLDTEINKNWYIGKDGNAYNEELSGQIINPKESKEITLIVSKAITEDNTGMVTNKAEIVAASNDLGVDDIDSIPGNGATSEDDIGQADVIISISTGGGLVNTMILITVLINLLLLGYVIKRKIDREREVIL